MFFQNLKSVNNFPRIFQNDYQFILDPWRHESSIWKIDCPCRLLIEILIFQEDNLWSNHEFCEIDDNEEFCEIGDNEAKFNCLQSIWRWIEYVTTQRERKEGMTIIGFKFADSAFFICQSWENCLVTSIRVFWRKEHISIMIYFWKE